MPVFLFTDIENSTRLWEQHMSAMAFGLVRHDSIVEDAITDHKGRVVKHTGDGMFAVFEGGNPLACALTIQHHLGRENWGALPALRVRVALDAGQALEQGGDYFGLPVSRAARLLDIGWGGQILLTPDVLHRCALPDHALIHDLGSHRLPQISKPERVLMLDHPALVTRSFPGLRSQTPIPEDYPAALELALQHKVESLALYTLVGMARLLMDDGFGVRAAEILSLVIGHPATAERVRGQAAHMLINLEASVPPAEIAAARIRSMNHTLEETITDLIGATALT